MEPTRNPPPPETYLYSSSPHTSSRLPYLFKTVNRQHDLNSNRMALHPSLPQRNQQQRRNHSYDQHSHRKYHLRVHQHSSKRIPTKMVLRARPRRPLLLLRLVRQARMEHPVQRRHDHIHHYLSPRTHQHRLQHRLQRRWVAPHFSFVVHLHDRFHLSHSVQIER